jgi:Amt family ammonium transporter
MTMKRPSTLLPLLAAVFMLAVPMLAAPVLSTPAMAQATTPPSTTPSTSSSTAAPDVASTSAAPAAAEAKIDTGDTAWMLTSTALVLMMTIPGLALFYGGMVRKKNILATIMQSFAICALVTVLWMVAGYSLAFSNGTPYYGDLSKVMLRGIENGFDKPFTLGVGTDNSTANTIPETVYLMFQMTFAIITPALIAGAFADRMKFSAMIWFMGLWSLLVYSTVAHWVWSPIGWINSYGAADFAGGTVVHINAGVAGLVCALVLGKRLGYGQDNMSPYNLTYAVIGASLLWVGWFGFNAGSAVGANGRAGMAMLATQVATGAAALAWMAAEWVGKGKPSVLGIISGAVAGLVAITPASGFVLPGPALIIGIAAGIVCYYASTGLKHLLGYDDSLDAFGVHGIGGIVGALLTGVFAYGPLSATTDKPGGVYIGGAELFTAQCVAVGATIVFSGVMSFVLLKIIDVVIGLRVTEDEEREGLDVVLHGERLG